MANTFCFKTKKSARDAAAMLAEATGNHYRVKEIASESGYKFAATDEPVEMITVVNLMSGEKIQIAADTPMCCNPSTETYWSM